MPRMVPVAGAAALAAAVLAVAALAAAALAGEDLALVEMIPVREVVAPGRIQAMTAAKMMPPRTRTRHVVPY